MNVRPLTLAELPIVNDWAIVFNPASISPYTAPEQISQSIHGVVFNHSKFSDGDSITTNSIVGKRELEGEEVVVTRSGSLYRLGEVLADYGKQFPDAKARLLNSMPEVQV